MPVTQWLRCRSCESGTFVKITETQVELFVEDGGKVEDHETPWDGTVEYRCASCDREIDLDSCEAVI